MRTPAKVLRHSVRVSLSLANRCFSELHRLVEHACTGDKQTERGGEKGLKIDLHEENILDAITRQNRIDGELENQLLLENHTTSLLMPGICVVALLCYNCEVGRSPKWWFANACRESVS